MAKRPLTASRVQKEKRPGRYFDGQNGLHLQVDPSGARRWSQRVVIRGKRVELGLGGYPLVLLNEARQKALENRRVARAGGDPRIARRSVPTFAEAAGRVHELNRPTWRNARHISAWITTLRTYAFPHFGDKTLDEVSGADVMNALTPIWTAKPETARRVRQRISAVMKWAIVNGFRPDNPAGDIETALPKTPRVKAHMAALPHAEVPAALASIRVSTARPATRLALEYLVLTAARSGEVRGAVWNEISVESCVWTIPAERMKAGREHRVPLSNRALEILDEARSLESGFGLVFPSSPQGKPLSDMAMTALLRRLRIPCVPHGFRSSFRDWAAECTDAPHAVMEAALAHVVANATEAAYFRSDLFDRRRRLMQQWADYLSDRQGA